jgi:hypothetical protein
VVQKHRNNILLSALWEPLNIVSCRIHVTYSFCSFKKLKVYFETNSFRVTDLAELCYFMVRL